jgi:3-oxoacyl-[acyl-carrier-protein] synthase I
VTSGLAILNTGLVTSVGLSAPAACAAIRAAITNHTETRFKADTGDWIIGAQVPLHSMLRGRARLVAMLEMAITECLAPYSGQRSKIPLLLCVAEEERHGRIAGLDETLLAELQRVIPVDFDSELSAIVPYGRASVGVALGLARRMMLEHSVRSVLIAAADSLLVGHTLIGFASDDRLLTPDNSNGFVPGEAAGAVLVGSHADGGPTLMCEGLGFSQERATIASGEPLRGEGLAVAIGRALVDANVEMHQLDFRITDNSGEQYYFKEAALALSRLLRVRKESFDIWHPADCIGEVGAAIGAACIAVTWTACRKAYALGNNILFHVSNDAGQRGAAVFRYRGTGL